MNWQAEVKKEGVKRVAATVSGEGTSGDIAQTCKPAEELCRPSKRIKGVEGSGDGDVDVVGTNALELPHLRFSCPQVGQNPRSIFQAHFYVVSFIGDNWRISQKVQTPWRRGVDVKAPYGIFLAAALLSTDRMLMLVVFRVMG